MRQDSYSQVQNGQGCMQCADLATVVSAVHLGHCECCECCQESQGSRLPNPHPQNLQHQCQPELDLTSLQTPNNTTLAFITPCHRMPYCIASVLVALARDAALLLY